MARTKKPAKQKTKAKAPAKLDAKNDTQLKTQIERIKAREGDRGKGPRLELEPGEGSIIKSNMPDDDLENALALFDLAGTANLAFAEHLMGQIVSFAINLEQKPGKNQKVVNAIMGAVHGLAPNDEAEAMLISQMAVCQSYAMELIDPCSTYGYFSRGRIRCKYGQQADADLHRTNANIGKVSRQGFAAKGHCRTRKR